MTESTGAGTKAGSTATGRGQSARTAAWRLRNWRLPTKLTAVLLIPTIAAVALGGLRVNSDLANAAELNRLANQIQLESAVADLVQQLQRERDLSASHVASGRELDRVVLDRQLRRVEDTVQALNAKIADLSADLDDDVVTRFRRASSQLDRLNSLRNAVRETKYPSDAVLRTYSESVESLLDLGEQAIAGINEPELVRLHLATNAIARIKEQESRKRGIMLDVFQRGGFGPGQERQLLAANAELDAARNDFRKSATPDQAKIYDDTVTGLIVDTANDMQETALNLAAARQPMTSLRPEKWDIASTLTVNLTRDVENLLLEQLQNRTDELTGEARGAAFRDSGIVLGALLLALVMALFVARSILNPLRTLRRTALEVADHGLPEAVGRILADPNPQEAAKTAIAPVPITTREEVGQVARAFDAVHGEAVRLAAEQALLRDNVNSMFVNLSRRSQALVERQLNLIDRLEQDEQDPDQLASLFELDHLATRMRRNSENLLVLSGTDLSRRLTRPVPAAEVLGAAVSEVEQYARVQVGQTPELTVQGRAVNDLVHLIAELLDNATAFSDPVTKVTVRTARTRKGELAIEIQDRGVGMGEQELADANQRLADPPDVDVAVSRRMGLYVVARLAKRHDIKVRLRSNEDIEGGTTALVLVPDTLVASPGSMGSPVGAEPASVFGEPGGFGDSAFGSTAQRASGIAGAFGTGTMSRLDEDTSFPSMPRIEDEPAFPVSFVQGTGEQDAARVPAFGEVPTFGQAPAETPAEVSQPWLAGAEERDVDREPEGSFGEPTLFTAYEDRTEHDTDHGHGFETTQFAPVDSGFLIDPEPEPEPQAAPPAREVEHDLDAPTERLPIYEAVLSQWFQAVGSETSAATAQAVPPAPAEPGLPTRKPRPVPPVAPTTSDDPLPQRGLLDSGQNAVPRREADADSLPQRGEATSGRAEGTSLTEGGLPKRQPGSPTNLPKRAAEVSRVTEPEPVAEPEPAALAAESVWESPADEGWQAAQALLNKAPETTTQAGLPKRVPKAQLVPGSAAPKQTASERQPQRPPLPPRSADAIRGRMSSLQQGVRRGRHALIDAYAGDMSSRQDEEQE
ncbi:nitrate- and nitrite sensing domain-containing protein [Saccharothrix sp. S26]|uniref:nitrate- and nitrite sensing domain-containing protein n=1 Tax=Saccharothrix sp. S26 TaxID=2907215 RepID=UPI001F39F875|nr:nitrate- and nitrite sensing domain-containing protein [Saccharothrix sp. S26]MCE6994175.1 nitrate- and nitrite sensing domain-containing protein [Saccharothrix sp. S26]